MKSLKRNVLILSIGLIALVFVFSSAEKIGLCAPIYLITHSMRTCRYFFDSLARFLFLVSPLILLFSLITYRMKEEVFQSWFKFAVWYVPAMAIGYLLYPGRGPSHSFGVGGTYADTFNLMLYTFVISIFVIVSIVRILKARKRARG